MPSVLNVDTLTDAAGTGPVTLTKQTATKAWVQYDHTVPSVSGSFNTASMTDVATGVMEQNFTNNMADGDYAAVGIRRTYHFAQHNSDIVQTGKFKGTTYYVTGTGGQRNDQDSLYTHIVINGDLA